MPTTTGLLPRQAVTTDAPDIRAELAQKVDVIIDGETYPLPNTGSMSLLRADRSTIVLQPSAVIALGQSVTVPPILAQTPPVPAPIDVGGLHLTVSPGQITPPIKPVPDTFKDLAGLAHEIEDGINGIKGQLDSFAGDASDAGGLQGDFLAKLDSLISNIDSFNTQLTGLSTPYLQPRVGEFQLEDFRPIDASRIVDAFKSTRPALSYVKDLRSLLKTGGAALSGPLTATLKLYWKDVAAGVVAYEALNAITVFANTDWGAAVKSQTSTTTSATSTTSSSATHEPTLYFFASKYGTKKSDFDNFCHDLDGTAGHLVSRDGSPWQGYETLLNQTQLTLVRGQPWLDNVEAVPELGVDEDEENFRYLDPAVLNKYARERPDKRDESNMKTDDHSPSQLQLLSAIPDDRPIGESNYRYDTTALGKGVTIYVVDHGFNKNAHELQSGPQGRRVQDYSVPNFLTLSLSVLDGTSSLYDEIPTGLDGPEGLRSHGTGVAVAAAGLNYGVARNADLFLIKYKGTIRTKNKLELKPPMARWAGVQDALDVIMADVKWKGLKGKAVVNMSFGLYSQEGQSIGRDSGLFNLFVKFERWCRESGVIWVAAAGNKGSTIPDLPSTYHLGDSLPQRLGTGSNALITVGGVNKDGWLWLETTPEGPARVSFPGEAREDYAGSIDIYAQAFNVSLDYANVNDPPDSPDKPESGTSFAAPQVAGLAAYFINKPPLKQQFTDQIATEMKGALRRSMVHWQKDANGHPVQAQVNSANNGARSLDEALCKRGEGKCPNNPPPPPVGAPIQPAPPPPPKDAYTGKCGDTALEFALYHDENCADAFDSGTICVTGNDCQTPSPGWSSMKLLNSKVKRGPYVDVYNQGHCGRGGPSTEYYIATATGCLGGFKDKGEKWTANSIYISDPLGPSDIF